jgi:hypothetical protein
VAARFRSEIEKAEAQGVARADMTLHLTLGDVSQLQRDRDLPVSDIRFAEGAMWYLDVRVEQGGVTVSELRHP